MTKKKKSSGWTLKPGQSVEDWRDDRRASEMAKLSDEERSQRLRRALGYDDDDPSSP
jgi:hypothetical protein